MSNVPAWGCGVSVLLSIVTHRFVTGRKGSPQFATRRRLQFCSLVVAALLTAGSAAAAQEAGQAQMTSVMQAPLEKSREAIIECRDKRLRGEISTYAESARCSNPLIFEAWKAANYPHMDLITEWLNAREAASEKVDQKLITPEAFERQMVELTARLTVEEQRRRAGLPNSVDSTPERQLPPPSLSAAGPAVAPAAQKPATKKNAPLRVAGANAYTDPPQGSAVGAMGSLSQFDSSKRMVHVADPPSLPAPDNPPARVATAHAEPSEASNNLYALLSSQQKEVDARAIYRMLQEKYPEILGKRNAIIRRAEISGQGTYYRVEVGPLSSGQADQLCGSLRQAGAQCTQHYE
jgi:hypothetical protein